MTDVDLKNNVNEKYGLKINVTTIKNCLQQFGFMGRVICEVTCFFKEILSFIEFMGLRDTKSS